MSKKLKLPVLPSLNRLYRGFQLVMGVPQNRWFIQVTEGTLITMETSKYGFLFSLHQETFPADLCKMRHPGFNHSPCCAPMEENGKSHWNDWLNLALWCFTPQKMGDHRLPMSKDVIFLDSQCLKMWFSWILCICLQENQWQWGCWGIVSRSFALTSWNCRPWPHFIHWG